MWITLLFLQGLVITALGNDVKDYCINSLLKCAPFQISFTERVFSDFFIECPLLLKRKCKSQQVFIECIEDAAWHCKQFNLTPVQAAFIETRDFAARLCTSENDELIERYVKSAVCINKQRPWTNLKCNPDVISERIQKSYPLIDFSCRYQKALMKCRRKAISKYCGREAGDIFKRVMMLELNLDYLCVDEKRLKDPSQYLMEIVNAFIGMLLDAIRPILGLETDFLEAMQASDESPSITKAHLEESSNESKSETTTKTCGDEDCYSPGKVSRKRRPKTTLDNDVLMHTQELHRYGDFMDSSKSDSDSDLLSNLEMETAIALKFYGEVLTELASMSTPAKPEPKPVQKQQETVAESCEKEECGTSRLRESYNTFENFEQESSATDEEEESDVYEAVDDENPEKETHPAFKIDSGTHMDASKIEALDPLKLPLKPLLDGKVKINYILVGQAYLPIEINFKTGDQDNTYRANVTISKKKYYLTPSTETVPPVRFEVEDSVQPPPDLVSKDDYESDDEHQISKWTESADKEFPEEASCEIKGNSTPLEILEQVCEIPHLNPQCPERFLTWKSEMANGRNAGYEKKSNMEENRPHFFCIRKMRRQLLLDKRLLNTRNLKDV